MPTYVPASGDATADARTFPTKLQTRSYSVNPQNRVTAQWDLKPHSDELLALIKARVSSLAYTQTFTCVSGLAVGDPVYISAANTATKADATTSTKAQVIGWVRYKPTTTSCFIDHFKYVSGLSFTAGNDVFLRNDSSYDGSGGTVPHIVGVAISTTEALLCATPIRTAIADGSITPAKLSTTYTRWRGETTPAPGTPLSGDMYFDTGSGHTFIYANTSWIQLD
jgi:hypothetical protein